MHPVNYLFEDIKRNHWGIASAHGRHADRSGPARRRTLFGLERKGR